MRKKVLIILPEKKFSEREFNAVKSACAKNFINIFIASDAIGLCTGDSGSKVKADVKLYNVHPANFDGICVTGGEGVRDYFDNSTLFNILSRFDSDKKPIGAICAAPVILAKAGILDGKKGVCFPSDKKEFIKSGVVFTDELVVQDKHIITARDAESAQQFATLFTESLLHSRR